MFNSILGRAKKALSRTDKIKSKEEADELSKETEEIKEKTKKASDILKHATEIKNISVDMQMTYSTIKRHFKAFPDMKNPNKGIIAKATKANFLGFGYKYSDVYPEGQALLLVVIDDNYIPIDAQIAVYDTLDSKVENDLSKGNGYIVIDND